MLVVQTIRVDPDERRAWRGEDELKLSRKEFDLLYVLILHAGTIVSRETLMREVWHTDFWTSSKTVDVHLGWLRRKIGDDARHPHLITTIRGRGLRFEITSDAGVGGGDPASDTGTPAPAKSTGHLRADAAVPNTSGLHAAARDAAGRRAAAAARRTVQALPA